MKFTKELLKKQIFFDAPETGGSGGGSNPPETGGEIEVPGYISEYVSGISDEGQRGYLENLAKDEQGLNTLKSFIKDPNAEWSLKGDTYKETISNADELIKQAKDIGYSEKDTQIILEQRANYLKTQKELMSKEDLAAEPNIRNFINSEKTKEIQEVYSYLAENAAGRKVLLELMKLKGGDPTPGVTGQGGGAGTYSHESFIAEFNKAKTENNKVKLTELESYAKAVKDKDDFFYDFMLLG